MSDDFDKDDLSWLQDADDEQSDDDHDEEAFDWQQSGAEGENQTPPDQKLGFTTELPWMQGEATGPDATTDDDELSWLTDDPAAEADAADVSWQDDDTTELGEEVASEDADLGDFGDFAGTPPDLDLGDLGGLGDVDESAPPPLDPDAVPDWLTGEGPTDIGDVADLTTASSDPTPGDPRTLPEWLERTPVESGQQGAPEKPTESELPDWLETNRSDEDLGDPGAVSGTSAAEALQSNVPDWLLASTSEVDDETPTSGTPGPASVEAVPDWLEGTEDAPPPTAADDDIDINAGPDWLQSEEPDPINDVPDWLAGEAPADESGMVDESGSLAADWLESGAELPETATSDLTYDEWSQQQEAASRPRDLEEQLPDLDQFAADDADSGASEIPDWFLGMEELDTSDAPAWFTDDEPAHAGAAPDDAAAADWLGAGPGTDTSELDDFFADLEDQAPAETGLGDDFFADLEPPATESVVDPAADDFFANFDTPDSDSSPDQQPVAADDSELDDFFANLGAGDSEGFDDLEPAIDMGNIDDFLATIEDSETDALTPPGTDLDAEDLATLPDGDILNALGLADETSAEDEADIDWFADEPAPDDLGAAGWLDDIENYDEAELENALASMNDLPEVPAEGLTDIDRLLAGYETDVDQLPDTGSLLSEETDFDTLFSDPAFSDIAPAEAEAYDIQPETPDWLTEAGASIGGPSAAAILRGQEDRPLDELPDRLQRLHDRGSAKELTKGDEGLDAFAPDLTEGTTATEVGMAGMAEAIVLSAQQTSQVELLKQLTAGEQASVAAGRRRAISEDPFLLDEDEQLEAEGEAPLTAPRRSLVSHIKWTRLLIALLVAVAVIMPFVADIRIGDLPPTEFVVGSRQQAVFNALAGLEPDDRVLVGMEYGPTGAAELDSTARVLLQHMLAQQVEPVIVSTNPVALLRANNLLTDLGRFDSPLLGVIGRNTPLRPNEDYYVARYIPATATGLRAFGANPGPQLALDLHGNRTRLTISDLDDFAQIVIIAERPDDLRAWAEQIAPLSNRPLLAATGRAAEPLIEPYLGSSVSGLLVGYADALTYANLLSTDLETQVIDPNATPSPTVEVQPTATLVPTTSPDPTQPVSQFGVIVSNQNINLREGPGVGFAIIGSVAPGAEVLLLGTSDDDSWTNIGLEDGTLGWVSSEFVQLPAAAAPTMTPLPTETVATTAPTEPATATPAPTDTALPTETEPPLPTNTPPATVTSLPTDTVAPSATSQPSSTPIPTATLETQVIARVVADGNVNVRSGPNTSFAPVGTAAPGDEFVVLGRNADGSWIQIEYPNLVSGQEAWIADFLLEIGVEPVEDGSATRPDRIVVVMAGSDFSGLLAQLEPTATIADTDDEAETALTTETPVAGPTLAVEQALPQAEPRWYAMNLGLLVIIVIILVGALVNIARAVLRRGA